MILYILLYISGVYNFLFTDAKFNFMDLCLRYEFLTVLHPNLRYYWSSMDDKCFYGDTIQHLDFLLQI